MKTVLILLASAATCFAQPLIVTDPAFRAQQVAATSGTSDVTAGLVGWWGFQDGSGTNAADGSGLSHNGLVVGSPVWSTGHKVGRGALYFPANTAYVEVSNPGNHLDGSNFTACAWLNCTNAANSYPRVIDRVYNGQFSCYLVAAYIGDDDNWCVTVNLLTPAGAYTSAAAAGGAAVPTNSWMHLTWRYDGTNTGIFTNGVYAGQLAMSPASGGLSASTSLIRIAQRADAGGNRGFTGWMEDVRLYSRALTTNEVWTVYNVTK